jgi:ABC-2 type transport system permease protein
MNVVRAEWTKLRTAPGTLGLLLAVIGTTVAVSALVTNAFSCLSDTCTLDPVQVSLTGVQLGQSVVAVVAVLAIGNEYSTGMVRTTFTAMPHRFAVLVAKAAVLSAVVLAAGAVAVAAALGAGRLLLTGRAPAWSLVDGPTLRAAGGSVLYLALIAVLSLGIGALARSSAAAIGVVLALLYVFPILVEAASDPTWKRRLERFGPTTAGLNVQATTGLDHLAIGPWAGLGVLAAWAAGALLIGGAVLARRDA